MALLFPWVHLVLETEAEEKSSLPSHFSSAQIFGLGKANAKRVATEIVEKYFRI